jgi:hypothetical protein
MTNGARRNAWWIGMAMALLAGCSMGSSGSAKGAGGPAMVRGAVQSTSNGLTVNGVAFRTTGASLQLPDDSPTPIVLENEDAVKGHLDDGMVVTVRGQLDDGGATGQATEIEFHDLMEATIDDKGSGRVRLLGEDLSVDGSTRVVDRQGNHLTMDDLAIGDRVEVSGHGDGRGGMRATFLRLRDDVAPGTDHEAKGYVIAISGTVLDLSFTRGGPLAFRADLAGIASPPAIAIGDLVELSFAEGNLDPTGDGIPDAVAAKLENELEPEHGAEAEVEGIVSAVDPAGFTVDGQPVVPDASAIFVGGTADDVVVGVKLEAEGIVGDDGILHAREIKFEVSGRIDANLGAVDPTASTLTLLGIVVHVSPSTELRSFGQLSDLALDSRVEVRGTPTADGLGLDATRVELISASPNDRAFLRAIVTAKTPDTGLTMLGLAIDVSAASFRDTNDAEIADPAAFFAAITEGRTIVKVRWRPYPASSAEPVDEAELEN